MDLHLARKRLGRHHYGAVTIAVALCAITALACSKQSEQIDAVDELTSSGTLMQIACLDINSDGWIDGGDADPAALPDVTGDGAVDEADTSIVSALSIQLSEPKPGECAGTGKAPDWLITRPPEVDCAAGARAVLMLGIGGGAVNLADLESAAGVRWMLKELGQTLSDANLPNHAVSPAPGLVGAENGHAASEAWSTAYLTEELTRQPCLQVVLLGHSHGGVGVTSIASKLEAAGLADRILLTVLIDRATGLYRGDTESLPQQSPLLNFYLPSVEGPHGAAIEQANVENVDASNEKAPEEGEEGGKLVPVTHSTVDNSTSVLEKVTERVTQALGVNGAR